MLVLWALLAAAVAGCGGQAIGALGDMAPRGPSDILAASLVRLDAASSFHPEGYRRRIRQRIGPELAGRRAAHRTSRKAQAGRGHRGRRRRPDTSGGPRFGVVSNSLRRDGRRGRRRRRRVYEGEPAGRQVHEVDAAAVAVPRRAGSRRGPRPGRGPDNGPSRAHDLGSDRHPRGDRPGRGTAGIPPHAGSARLRPGHDPRPDRRQSSAGAGLTIGPIGYWVYVDTMQPARLTASGSSPAVGNLDVDATIVAYNEPVTITAPQSSQVNGG